MKEYNIKSDKKNNRLIIRGNRTQSISRRELSTISEHSIKGILEITILHDIAPVELSINTHGFISFADYLNRVIITKKLFLWLIRELIEIIKTADSMRFNVRLFVYDIDYVFIEQCSQEISLTYIPLQPCELEGNISDLFNQFVSKATFDSNENLEYIHTFFEIFNNKNFSMFIIEEFLLSIERDMNQYDRGEEKAYCPHCKSLISASSTKCDFCGYQIIKDRLNINKNDVSTLQPSVVVNEDSSGIVTVFKASTQKDYGLLCKHTGQIIMINKTPFRVGKLLDTSDLRIENNAVSRKHADIIQELDKCYIVDLYSKNGTYINGRRINSGVKEEIHEDDVIMFANASFILIRKGEC